MKTVFSDPRNWAGTMVRTWPRFWFMATALIGFIMFAVFAADSGGWRRAAGVALFLAIQQVLLLYALRRLYLEPPEKREANAI